MVHQSLRKVPFESLNAWKEDIFLRPIKRKQEEWTIDQLEDIRDKRTSSQKLHSFVFTSIPQIRSRIFHAAHAIFPEIGRGHFVPMLAIALACLGRIYSSLMQIGRGILTCLQNESQIEEKVDHLFDVSHDELAIKLNRFLNDMKWRDAIIRFRLGKCFLNVKKERGGNVDGGVKMKSSIYNAVADGVSCDDMGEVISAEQNQLNGQNDTYKEGEMLANLPPLLAPAACSIESAGTTCDMHIAHKPKKKKRKRKKKDSSMNGNIDDSFQSGASVSKEVDATDRKKRFDTTDCGFVPSFPKRSETPTPSNIINTTPEKNRTKDCVVACDRVPERCGKEKHCDAKTKTAKRKKKKAKKRGSVIDNIFS